MAIPSASLPRFLLPRAQFLLRPSRPLLRALPSTTPSIRHASKKTTPQTGKPFILEKPEKFNPPSHGRRLPKTRPGMGKEYGPKPTAEDLHRFKTKKYPNMMAPEGTRMHWFLHSRSVHVCITMSVLLSLALGAVFVNFHTTTPYRDLLPSARSFLTSPLTSFSQFIEVYKMHTAYTSAQTAERRKKKVEDVKKRAEYRKAHGLEKDDDFWGWTAKSDAEALGPAITGTDEAVIGAGAGAGQGEREGLARRKEGVCEDDPRYYIGADGVRRRRVKKWFGIWE